MAAPGSSPSTAFPAAAPALGCASAVVTAPLAAAAAPCCSVVVAAAIVAAVAAWLGGPGRSGPITCSPQEYMAAGT